ncbi:MAG: 50S ribosomal protein L29 [Caldilineaceae bacterium]|nr:50S ribosomal protein L29 [Caldilineaceae bacterium]MBP8109071.1 50S ribosomal protein L29 [Caldilineaceae bacterium]MBP8122054.1 50S ribosomal protein L29 [Caldilineaceae bacterium]
MKATELRAMTNAELANKLDDSYQEMFNLRFQESTGQVKNTARERLVRRGIARMKTILRERELA